jgi:hypothetical protein
MATGSAVMFGLIRALRPKTSSEVELSFRADYADDRLSAGELEALCPVLPELIGELLAMSRDEFGE